MAKHIKRPGTLQIIGESLITAGIILLLYVVWQLFINDPVVSNNQQHLSKQYANEQTQVMKQFADQTKNLKQGKVFAKLYVPRFGKDYERVIGQGTFQKITLNVVGVGHYLSSEWPGQTGNFAVAAHRTSHGAPFSNIDKLTAGDKVWVETNDNWFTYEYRQTKIVDPSDVGVIQNVPVGLSNANKSGYYMTMTSCHPKWSNRQRIVVWLELVNTQPKGLGKPQDLIEAQK